MQTRVTSHWESGRVWLAIYTLVMAGFFFEHLFLGRSLLPLDVLNQMLMPREPGSAVEVQTHYGIDQITQLAPNMNFWRESVSAGEFPLWNPHFLGGHPHHGATGWTMMTPFKLPLLLPLPMERVYTWTLVLEFWMSGAFLFALLRHLGRSAPAAFMGALAWALCSNLLLFHWIFISVFVWVPLLLLSWDRAWATGSLAWGGLAALSMAFAFLGGSVQMVAFVGFFWGVWSLGSLSDWSLRELFRWCLWAFGIFGLAAALCAIQWLPTFEFLSRETQRLQNLDPGAFGLKHALLGPVIAAVQFFVPALVGSPQTFDALKLVRGSLIDFNGYIGVVPALLAIVGAITRPDRRTRNLLLLTAVVGFLVFFTPLQRFVYHRFLILAVLSACLLAARGLDLLRDGLVDPKVMRRICVGARAGGVLTLVGVAVVMGVIAAKGDVLSRVLEEQVRRGAATNQFGTRLEWLLGRVPKFLNHYRPWNPDFLLPAGAAIAFGWIGLRSLRIGASANQRLAQVAVLVAVIDLSCTLRDRVSRVDTQAHPAYALPPLLAPLKTDPDWFRIYRWLPADRLTLMDNLSWAWGFHQLSGYESMSPDGLSRLPLNEAGGFNAIVDLCSVKYLIVPGGEPLAPERFQTVTTAPGLKLVRNLRWLPPVQWVGHAVVLPKTSDVVRRLREPTFDPRTVVYLDSEPVYPGLESVVAPASASVRIHGRSAQRMEAEVASPKAGIVVFAETWFPGWRVFVDGKEAALLRANAYMQAVAVGPGIHQVQFRFEPASFAKGGRISAAALVVCLVVLSTGLRRSNSSTASL